MFGLEGNENIINEREVFSAAEFEDENEIHRIGVAEIGLVRSVIEDFFG